MSEAAKKSTEDWAPGKTELLRDAVVFQFKLLVDGIRDFVLIPVSLAAAIVSFLKPGAKAGTEFYDVVAFGRTTERKINLFSAADKRAADPVAEELPDLDTLVDEIESFARKEYAGERFAPARQRLKKLLESIQGPSADHGAAQDRPDAERSTDLDPSQRG
ncbi:MAG: hypothetical protein AAFU65_04280 [Pseudomonadota bacterium]